MRKEIGHNSSLGWTEFVQEGGEKEVEVDIPVYPGGLELQYIYIYIYARGINQLTCIKYCKW